MNAYQDKMVFGVVSMTSVWGDCAANAKKMDAFIEEAASRGCQMLLFPELCVTGYRDGYLDDGRRMHPAVAQPWDGPIASHFGEMAKKHNMYLIYGMSETIEGDPEHAYNSAFIAKPDGSLDHYHKIHPVEPDWCRGGDRAMVLETPWGPMGMSVCYDTYAIPELERYYAALGCRMILNPTASARGMNPKTGDASGWLWYYTRRLETICDRDGIFVASANLTGPDGKPDENGKQPGMFPGGSFIVSPVPSEGKYITWAVGSPEEKAEGVYCGEIDLSQSKRDFFQMPIYRPDLYAGWYEELAENEKKGIRPAPAEKQSIRIGVVNFDPTWGDVEKNIKKIEAQTAKAADQGADLVLFPELSLTGYWYKEPENGEPCMQQKLAQTIPGPATERFSRAAVENKVYLVVGMPEKDAETGKVYNSAAIMTPDGKTLSYRKIHPIGDEQKWAACGDKPLMLDTPWGLIGMSICYDTYFVPELERYYAASGAKILLNPTASIKGLPQGRWHWYYTSRLESIADRDGLIVASANLCGPDAIPFENAAFPGGSVVLGATWTEGVYYGGTIENNKPGVIVSRPVDLTNVKFGMLAFLPELYAKFYREIQKGKENGTL